MSDRYDVSGSIEGQFEPGSDDRVLRNKLGITDPEEMDQTEFERLLRLEDVLLDEVAVDQQFNNGDLRDWHERWLGDVYEWAGRYRTVGLSKDGFPFAVPERIPSLMSAFESDCLEIFTPCVDMDTPNLIEALSVCHVELVLIHPFRDGNGRIARLLATLMAIQAGYPPLDFQYLVDQGQTYIGAIHAGVSEDYGPMKRCFETVIRDSLQRPSGNAP